MGREDQQEIHLGHKEEMTAHSCCSVAFLHTRHPLIWQWKPCLLADPQSGSQDTPLKTQLGFLSSQVQPPRQPALQEQDPLGLKAVDHPQPNIQGNAHQHAASHSTGNSYSQGYGHLLSPWWTVRPGIVIQIHFQALIY